VIGLVSAGEMGSALGGALRRGGATVLTSVAGRSERTARLAGQAGLDLVADLDEVVRRSTVLLSVVPPQDARAAGSDLIGRARRLGVRPLLADLNAVAPAEVAELATLAAAAGLPFVDGAVSGAPPGTGSAAPRLLLAGRDAAAVAGLPWTGVDVSVIGDRPGAASAAKMCTGGVRKGVTALLINALLTAAEHGVLEPVEAELRRALKRDPLVEVELAAAKAWRFVPEMDAVAATQEAAGLDPATYRAIADVFRRTATSELAERQPEDVERQGRDGEADAAVRRAAVTAALRPRP
jgi:3-hydroxyisobutyrate dehydrogenase-like beta-hydroxyacid dehydrogenase